MANASQTQVREQIAESRNVVRNNDTLPNQGTVQNEGGGPNRNIPARQGASDRAVERDSQQRSTPGASGGGPPYTPNPVIAYMQELQMRAGDEPLPQALVASLDADFPPEIIDIKPEGTIYVTHTFYRDRLDAAYGPGGWRLIALAQPVIKGNSVILWCFLKAGGQYVGDAYGGAEYWPNNPQDSYDSAIEKARSDALVKCCKNLPMFRRLWDKEFCDAWKEQYAQEVVDPRRKSGKSWRKNGEVRRQFDVRPGRLSQGEYHKSSRLEDENQRHIDAIPGNKPLLVVDKHDHNENEPGYNEWEEQE